jgi:polar amino acid transport system substrate-binding protein
MRLFTALMLPAILAVGPAFGDALAEIRERGSFRFGLEAQYKPFGFRDESNAIVGYDIDVAAEIGKRLGGVEPVPTDTNWATVIQSLYNGDFDFILGGMTATAPRFERVNFSYPYMDASSGILVKADAGIETPADLAGKAVSAGAGTPQVQQLELAAEEHGITYNGEIRTYDDDTVALAAMNAGRIDAYASTLVSLLELAKTAEGVTVIPFTSTKWSQEFTAMAFRKEDEPLRTEINRIIAEMKDDGTLAALQEKWFGQSFVDILPNEAPTW